MNKYSRTVHGAKLCPKELHIYKLIMYDTDPKFRVRRLYWGMVTRGFGISYEKQNYLSIPRPSLLSCPFTLATGSKTHSHHAGLQSASRRAEWKPFLRLHAAFVRDSPKQALLAQGMKAAELLCACVARASKPDTVSKPESWHQRKSMKLAWQLGGCLLLLLLQHPGLVNMIQSRKQTCHRIIGSHHSRGSDLQEKQFLSQPGKQRQGSPKNDGKIPTRGRHSRDTSTSGKCLESVERVTVEEKLSATDLKSGNLFYSL